MRKNVFLFSVFIPPLLCCAEDPLFTGSTSIAIQCVLDYIHLFPIKMIFSCAKIIWSANGLRPSEVQTLMTASSGRAGLNYRVDVDLLGLYHKGYSFANATHDSAADFVIKKIRLLAYEGYEARLVIDGPTRPDCKRSS